MPGSIAMSEENFEFEKLDLYELALQLLPIVTRIMKQLPRGYGDLKDHLRPFTST